MKTRERIDGDLKNAMRDRSNPKLVTLLRSINAAIKQVEVDERIVVDEARLISILKKLEKQRKESISQFAAAARDDLVAQEQFELEVIMQYLPEQLGEKDLIEFVEKAILETGAQKISDMGKVMAQLKPVLQGRADMSQVNSLIKERLN